MRKTKLSDFDPDVMESVGAVVLGGGRGTRLYPLTKYRAKPAVPLAGRYRLIDIPLSNCIHSDVMRMVILTQFNSHSLNRHVVNTYKFDAFTRGYVSLLAAEQTNENADWFQGTADAVRKHMSHIRDYGLDYHIVLAGDQLYRMDYRVLMRTLLQRDADIAIAALPVDEEAAKSFGIMKVQSNGRIREFVEKPQDKKVLDEFQTPKKAFDDFGLESKGKPYLASMGIYAFKAGVLEELVMGNREWVDFGKELIPNALKSHKVYAHMFNGFWEDIGTVRSYFDVSLDMTAPNPPFQLYDEDQPIYTHARSLPGAEIEKAEISRAVICAGSSIKGAKVSNAIVGIRSVVQQGAEIERSVVLGADYYEDPDRRGNKKPIGIGANTRISNAIIDHNARIGKKCVIKGSKRLKDCDEDSYSIRDGIIVVHKDAVIPDGTEIG